MFVIMDIFLMCVSNSNKHSICLTWVRMRMIRKEKN